ncbi:MAG: MFS transporter [Bacteroidetes bacterium]|nr:MAG: MFS transporter [Bacteroidota bacterium]TAE72853.1 MAG: MFS transporter [Bacteroidota bacterium]TAF89962.1 MAG: MFS transporter [Bacteroidota bacterium]
MGLPNLVLGGTLASLLYKQMGFSDSEIAFWTGLIILPWSFKPLWGPFMELYKTKRYYIYSSQLVCGVLFAAAAASLYSSHFFGISLSLFFVLAFAGATQDIAADGLYMQELSETEQAQYVGWQGTFYNFAKLFSNGGMVFLLGILTTTLGGVKAWTILLLIYAAVMLLLGVYNKQQLPPQDTPAPKNSSEVWLALKDVMVSFFAKKNIWWGIAFIVLYRFAEGQAIKIMPLFFKASIAEGGLALQDAQLGMLAGIYGTIAFVLGSILAGYYVAKRGLNRTTLLILCAAFNLPFATYAYLAITQTQNMWLIGSAVSIEHFGYGFGFIGIILFIMQQIAPGKYQMAHYAFGSAITYFGYTLASMVSGLVSDYLGYKQFFIWVLIATIPAFMVTSFVPLQKQLTEKNV